jgi:hypothetical protein
MTSAISTPSPSPTAPLWHVSAWVDVLGYHFSWLILLIPLLFMGDHYPVDYRFLLVLTLGINVAHQALSIPFLYLEPGAKQAYGVRVWVVPALLFVAFWLSAFVPQVSRPVIGAVTVVVFLWNFWHLFMQKYGLLRMYSAKAKSATPVPGWIDRFLVFSWVPLIAVVVAPRNRAMIYDYVKTAQPTSKAIIEFIDAWWSVLIPVAAALPVLALGLFARAEWRAHRMTCVPRLSMVAGLTCVSIALLTLDPIKVVIAFAFGHSLEYIVFAWAWKRRKDAVAPSRSALLRWAGRQPLLAFVGFIVVIGTVYSVITGWGVWFQPGTRAPRISGHPIDVLVVWFAFYLSVLHFWIDGFAWKMRRPEVRSGI